LNNQSQNIYNSASHSAVASAAKRHVIGGRDLSFFVFLAVLLSVIIIGGIISNLSIIGLIQILPILISGIIINLILIIQ
jgi:hypothetical protein